MATEQPNAIHRPAEVMRERHPDLFSDSHAVRSRRLAKPVFEYHLETLTSRKQEYEFEDFCRRLAEEEICPNLRVQTGPTGGGDSKVDSETFPVSVDIASRWWIGQEAASELWAFAFSANKKWKAKLESDVSNIISTGRKYRRIHFFTNQFVSDRQRAKIEDQLTEEVGIPVHVYDRAWIVAKVYDHGHLDLAMSALGIDQHETSDVVHRGPRDTARLLELEEVDRRIHQASTEGTAKYQLVEDVLRSALLARGIERSFEEVDARFSRAAELAKELGYAQQVARVAYNRAWTAYWWMEDFPKFSAHYDELEALVGGSLHAPEIERLVTLWQLIRPVEESGAMASAMAKSEERRLRLVEWLQPLATDPLRLNNALQAETSLAFIALWGTLKKDGGAGGADAVWNRLSRVLDRSEGLWGYPVERLAECLEAVGSAVDSVVFDALYEKTAAAVAKRRSEGEAGRSYATRARQKLEQKKPYEAIRWFGRAEELLVKEEYRSDLVEVLLNSARAFEMSGLLWAARSKLIVAAERSFVDLQDEGVISVSSLIAVNRLTWIELQVGRITCALEAMQLASLLSTTLVIPPDHKPSYDDDVFRQEAALGILFERLPNSELQRAGYLVSRLEGMGLLTASLGLLLALRQDAYVREEASDEGFDPVVMRDQWLSQPIAESLPSASVMDGPICEFTSTVLGSRLVAVTGCNRTSIGLVESLFGAFEALVATSDEADVIPTAERTRVKFVVSDEVELCIEATDDLSVDYIVRHHPEFSASDARSIEVYREWLETSLVLLLGGLFSIRDANEWMEKKGGEERAFSRALLLGDAWGLARTVFGSHRKIFLNDWVDHEDVRYECLRGEAAPVKKSTRTGGSANWGAGEPPADLFDFSQLRHTDRQFLSPIVSKLWDRARWRGVVFALYSNGLPGLGLLFEDSIAAEAIFDGWRAQLGDVDTEDTLRVSIVRGIDSGNPCHYWVTVGPNLDQARAIGTPILTASRLNKMTPETSDNLGRFVRDYKATGCCVLAPARTTGIQPEILGERGLLIRTVEIREAWQIGENDPDVIVLKADDSPVIPEGIDAPVIRALARVRARKHEV